MAILSGNISNVGFGLSLAPSLARKSALSAALHHGDVLGRQCDRGTACRRAYSACDARLPALVACLPADPSLGLEASEAGLARDPRQASRHDHHLVDRDQSGQHAAILRARAYRGAEHAAPAIGRTADRRDLVLD